MSDDCKNVDYNRLTQLVVLLCNIILIERDSMDEEEFNLAYQYIDQLCSEDICLLNKNFSEIELFVKSATETEVFAYIDKCEQEFAKKNPCAVHPFEFASGGRYDCFCQLFNDHYSKTRQGNSVPYLLSIVLNHIKSLWEHYEIFIAFYKIRSTITADSIIKEMEQKAEKQAGEAVKKATSQEIINTAKAEAKSAVKDKMNDVTQHVTKTSVTTLGLFTGIIFAFIGSLFYSASILESVSSTNIWTLISISSLVGLVCYHLIAVMFRFVSGVNNTDDKPNFKFSCRDWIFTILLLLLLTLGIVGQFKSWPSPNIDNQFSSTQMQTDVNKQDKNSQVSSFVEDTSSTNSTVSDITE